MLQLRGKWNYPFGTFKPFLYMNTTQQIVDPLKQLYSVYLYTVAGKHTKWQIKVITKLPNSEQSYKGKVQTHNYINRQNQSTTGKLWKP